MARGPLDGVLKSGISLVWVSVAWKKKSPGDNTGVFFASRNQKAVGTGQGRWASRRVSQHSSCGSQKWGEPPNAEPAEGPKPVAIHPPMDSWKKCCFRMVSLRQKGQGEHKVSLLGMLELSLLNPVVAQYCADNLDSEGGKKAWNCNICQFPWSKYSHDG